MQHSVWTSDKLKLDPEAVKKLIGFLQMQANRYGFGNARYGEPRASKKYLTKLKKELKAYQREGNMEQLLNIGVYAFLESLAPENKKFHFDPYRESVTRK